MNIAPVFPAQPVFFIDYLPCFKGRIYNPTDPFSIFGMQKLFEGFQVDLLEFFRVAPCKVLYCSCPPNLHFFNIGIKEHSTGFFSKKPVIFFPFQALCKTIVGEWQFFSLMKFGILGF